MNKNTERIMVVLFSGCQFFRQPKKKQKNLQSSASEINKQNRKKKFKILCAYFMTNFKVWFWDQQYTTNQLNLS